jgi:ASCH domain
MKALTIRSPWIDLILAGQKTWEMRSRRCHVRGPIALIQAGSGLIVGTADMIDCLPKLNEAEMRAHQAQHGIPEEMLDEVIAHGWVVPWVLSNVRRLAQPVPYKHPWGAVTWIDVPDDACAHPQAGAVAMADRGLGRGQWADITVTQGNINWNHLYVRQALSLLPQDCIGGHNETMPGKPITLHLEGVGQVETDVDGRKMFFRRRSQVGRFFAQAGVSAGDTVRLTRLSEREFHAAKLS